jgi:hypothetical protein
MTRPGWCDEKTWDSAAYMAMGYGLTDAAQLTLATSIARAIMAERERCAGIAERDCRSAIAIAHDHKPDWYWHAQNIAASIRNGDAS